MLPFSDARFCLTCAQKSSSVMLEKFNTVMKSGTSLGRHSQANFKSAQNCSTMSVNHLPFGSKGRISWYFNYMCRYSRTLPKRNTLNYQNKQLFKVNRNALFNYQYAPHHRHSDTEKQCRTYTTKSVNETLTDWTEQLMTAGVPEARLSVEHIIAHILDVSQKELSVLGESQLSEGVLAEAERLMTCRLAS